MYGELEMAVGHLSVTGIIYYCTVFRTYTLHFKGIRCLLWCRTTTYSDLLRKRQPQFRGCVLWHCVEESVASNLLRMSSALNLYLLIMSSDVSRYVTPQVNHVTWRSLNACFLQLSMAYIGNNCIYGGVIHLCSQINISTVASDLKCKYSVAVPSCNNNVSVVSGW